MKTGTHLLNLRSKPIGTAGLLLASMLLLWPGSLRAQDSAAPKRILVLYWYDKDFPFNATFDSQFRAVIQSTAADSVEYFPEYLESNRFPGENQSLLLSDYLREKYADRHIDVVVASGYVTLDFLCKYRDSLFPDAQVVFLLAANPTIEQVSARPRLTGIITLDSYFRTLDLALSLHPATERVFIVSGTLERDKNYEVMAREGLRGFERKVQISYLTDLSPDDLMSAMRSLPERSIVLYVWQQTRNNETKVVEFVDVLSVIAKSARVPVYGMSASYVGQGIIGGYVNTPEKSATKVAEIALRVANGEPAENIPIDSAPTVAMFDWRELRRWGISEDEVPAGSVVLFREQTFWEHYKWRIIGVIGLIVLQASFILVLLEERRWRQRALAALDLLNIELEQRVTERTAELASKTRELEAFTYTVAHDLKAPLRGIDGYSRLLLEDHLNTFDDKGQGFLKTIRSSADQMKQLIEDLLAYSQAERRELNASRIELRSFIEKLVAERSADLEARGIAVTLNVNGDSVTADAAALGQAVRNYLDNAVKFTRDSAEPRIEIGGEFYDKVLRIWVRDNGTGFDVKYQEQIFDIFRRLHSADDYPGTGIGLAIVRKAIERMNGRVWAESEPGRGATFYIEIPSSPPEVTS
jgi:signal transduction histidine kinase